MLSALGARVRKVDVAGISTDTMDVTTKTSSGVLSMGRFSRVYDRFVRRALARKKTTVGGRAGRCSRFASRALPLVGRELIPPLTEGEFFFEVKLPQGASLAATDRVMQELEAAAAEDSTIEQSYSRVGSRLVAGGVSLNTVGEHFGQINVALKNKTDDRVEAAAIETLRKQLRGDPRRRPPSSDGRRISVSRRRSRWCCTAKIWTRCATTRSISRATWRPCRDWSTCARRSKPATPSCTWCSTATSSPR